MTDSHYYLQQMGITPWVLRQKVVARLVIVAKTQGLSAERLLNKILQSVQLQANDVYIVDNLPENIKSINPKLILVLHEDVASLKQSRERMHPHQGIDVMVSYHPAYLLRNPQYKKKAYHDWLKVRQWLS